MKLLTTPEAPERAVLEGARAILSAAGCAPGDIGLVVHGTTLATNALIERKGAPTALLTTEGFRDSVEMAYEHRFEQYDLSMQRPEPLVPRDLRLGVPERIAADGSVLLALDEAALRETARTLRARGIVAVAVCFLHSFTNPAHERRAGAILAEEMPDAAITLSCEVAPEIREYERASTTIANAYVLPLMGRYLAALEQGLRDAGMGCPLLLMMSSGGVTTVDTAKRFPVRLVESGPAGGAILAQAVAAENGLAEVLAFDMGGTTAKLTLIDALEFQRSRSFEVARAYRFIQGSGLPVRIPVIELVEIGAGGGSIARVDALGRILVGPDSAGSVPGPACYGRGGTQPTVTDADAALGRLDPSRFAGGSIGLDVGRAEAAVGGAIAGMAPRQGAVGIAEIVDETMANAARVHAVENGKDTAGRAMIAFGGAAPLHAGRLAEKLGISRIIVPKNAGVGSALGFLRAPVAFDLVHTALTPLRDFDARKVADFLASLKRRSMELVEAGAAGQDLSASFSCAMRYSGQGHEIAVAIAGEQPSAGDLRAAFEAEYRRLFGRTIPGGEIEVLSWQLRLSRRNWDAGKAPPEPAPSDAAAAGRRPVFDLRLDDHADHAVYRREDLEPGSRFEGPAIVVEDETSTVVPESFRGSVDGRGNLVLWRREGVQP
jgi:N-methylhydantoinase A